MPHRLFAGVEIEAFFLIGHSFHVGQYLLTRIVPKQLRPLEQPPSRPEASATLIAATGGQNCSQSPTGEMPCLARWTPAQWRSPTHRPAEPGQQNVPLVMDFAKTNAQKQILNLI